MNPLSVKEEEEFSGNITDWEIVREGTHKLSKMVETDTFMDAVNLIRAIAEIAESEQHHPDLHLYYNKLNIILYTHKANGLTENDFIMAAKIDDILRSKGIL